MYENINVNLAKLLTNNSSHINIQSNTNTLMIMVISIVTNSKRVIFDDY